MSEPRLLTADEAAAFLRIKVSTLREHTRQGRVPHLRIGRAVRYDADDLASWLDELKRPVRGS